MTYKIRPAEEKDIKDICRIYNYYIANSTATFREEPDEEAKFLSIFNENKANNIPFAVAELNGKTVGYSYLYSYNKERSAYRFTYCNVIYVDPEHHGKSIGSRLLDQVITEAKKTSIHRVISFISLKSETNASVKLHQKHGFEVVGRMSEAGYKFNEWIDIVTMQLKL